MENMEKLYSTAEVSEYLKVSEITIRRFIKAGKLKTKKVGNQYRIPESFLREFLNTGGNQSEEN